MHPTSVPDHWILARCTPFSKKEPRVWNRHREKDVCYITQVTKYGRFLIIIVLAFLANWAIVLYIQSRGDDLSSSERVVIFCIVVLAEVIASVGSRKSLGTR